MKRRNWTLDEINYLIDNYADKSSIKIAAHLNRPICSVYGKAYSLCLKKSVEFLSSPESGMLTKGTTLGLKTQYKKGHTPFNKGKKLTDLLSPESMKKVKSTWYKPGNLPHNAKHDGYERLNVDGYIEVRVSIGNFKFKHHVVWEKHHGPVPKGMNLVFINGDKTDIRLDNLKLISNAELMQRNTINRYPKDLRRSLRLVAKLNSKIKNHGKKQNFRPE